MLLVVVRNRNRLLGPTLQAPCSRQQIAKFPRKDVVVRLKETVVGRTVVPLVPTPRIESQVFNVDRVQII